MICDARIRCSKEDFRETLRLITTDPQVMSPQFLRAEITSEKTLGKTSRIARELIPKQPRKDAVVHEVITMWEEDCCSMAEFNATVDIGCTIPYNYPKSAFRFVFETCIESVQTSRKVITELNAVDVTRKENICTDEHLKNSSEIFENKISIMVPQSAYTESLQMLKIWSKILKSLIRFSTGFSTGYKKRVHRISMFNLDDIIVAKRDYQDLYALLKEKYCHWVEDWPDSTDSSKFVFEDIGIATFLILLWRSRNEIAKKRKFLDLGCGNGFLTYLLFKEGYNGYGVDLSRRGIWTKFEKEGAEYEERPVFPQKETFENVEWIIGNHPDELTLWVPIIAQKSTANFVIIPCCPFDLSGKRFTKKNHNKTSYQTFIDHVEVFCGEIGFTTIREHLRIPSTKNLAIVSTGVASFSNFCSLRVENVEFVLRKSDKELTKIYQEKQAKKVEKLK